MSDKELNRIVDVYKQRAADKRLGYLYNPLNPYVFMSSQEKERVLIRILKHFNMEPLDNKKVLEVGCGTGGNILTLLKLGFNPENIVANDLMEERALQARRILPELVQVIVGDAGELEFEPESFDLVLQFTVFSSILDWEVKKRLAEKIWCLLKPGGGIIWYDFAFNNPRNPNVKGVKLKEIRELFPDARIKAYRVTLAPPLGRLVTRISPQLYLLFNSFIFLRTHLMCWIGKDF